MKNIQVIDGAQNCVYDIFSATESEFSLIYPVGQDVAFIDEVIAGGGSEELTAAFKNIWRRRIAKKEAMGIHGLLFYELECKKVYYPTRRDEEAINPDGNPFTGVTPTVRVGNWAIFRPNPDPVLPC